MPADRTPKSGFFPICSSSFGIPPLVTSFLLVIFTGEQKEDAGEASEAADMAE